MIPGLELHRRLWACLRYSHPPSALLAVLSLAWPRGELAALLASPWFLFTALMAVLGARRLLLGGRHLWKLCVDTGLILSSVGGAFVVLSRLGVHPLGFSDEIVLLTGVHFHYAGFVLPLLAGLVGRELPAGRRTRQAYRYAAWAVIVGPPILAMGINANQLYGVRLLETGAAWFLASGTVVLAAILCRLLIESRGSLPSAFLLLVAVGSVFLSMLLASIYALGRYLDEVFISIPSMVATHGLANALGFSLCGLLGWWVRGPSSREIGARELHAHSGRDCLASTSARPAPVSPDPPRSLPPATRGGASRGSR